MYYNGASTIDYHLASSHLLDYITKFEISHRNDSDHFPVAACLTLPYQNRFVEQHINYIENEFINLVTYKWNEQFRGAFIGQFLHYFENEKMLIQTNIYENIDRSIQKILDIYHKTAESLNLRQTYKKLCNNNQLWWDSACDRSKQYKYKMLRNF